MLENYVDLSDIQNEINLIIPCDAYNERFASSLDKIGELVIENLDLDCTVM